MKRFFLALRFLTVFPFGAEGELTADDLAGSTVYYPLVGALVGLVLYGFWLGAGRIWPAVIVATLTVVLWLLVTAGLHMDGLMDMFDGLGVRGDRKRRLEVMRDSRVGAFGVLAAVTAILLKAAAIWTLSQGNGSGLVLLLAPVAGRTAMVVLMAVCNYAREGTGLGRVFTERTGPTHSIVATILFLLWGSVVAGPNLFWLVLPQIAVFLGFRFFVLRNFGGITGDILGAACEIHEAVLLLTVAAMLG
jgi:adenosylcobinamide-GDP ribazoletransferase